MSIYNKFKPYILGIASCILITTLGIVFLVMANPGTTTIGEDISTAGLTATGTISLPNNSITDAMTVNTLTASNYLPLSGGTIAGDLVVDDTISEGGTSLIEKYLGITDKASDSDKLDNQDSTYFTNATNLGSGTVPTNRISGSYTGITGLGAIASGNWQGSVIADDYLSSSSNWNTAHAYSQAGHLPLSGGTITGDLTVDTNTFYVDSVNNLVGIGTSNPSRILHILATGTAEPGNTPTVGIFQNSETSATSSEIQIISGTTGKAQLSLGDTASGQRGMIQYDNSADSLIFKTSGVKRFSVDVNGKIIVGTTTYSSIDPILVIGGSRTGSGNAHAFVDEASINKSGTIGYNSFDNRITITGSNNYNHASGFQAAPTYSSSGAIDRLLGASFGPTITSGTVDKLIGYRVNDANVTGGTVNNSYGLYFSETLDAATNNWAIYSAGDTKSYFGGNVGIGDTTPATKLDVDGIIKTAPRSSATCNADSEGGIFYDSDDNHFYGCNGANWVRLDYNP